MSFLPSSTPKTSYDCFVLLDDTHSQDSRSRFYDDFAFSLPCSKVEDWPLMWQTAQTHLEQGLFVVAVLRYETGAQLQNITPRDVEFNFQVTSQLLVFRRCQHWTQSEVQSWLQESNKDQFAGIRNLRPNIDQIDFCKAIEKIQTYIAAGDTYQVNYTYRLHFETYGPAASLFQALRQRQPVPFAALIGLPNGAAILSLSPELFVRHQAGHLTTKPMKGTAAASGNQAADLCTADQLRQDPKNRAENLMIVDLLRNDLGRIAQTGSVQVPALFEVQQFTSVLQMTSTIQAQLRPELNLEQIMSALFPCGSITGAPKRRTMEIIREVETEDRGVYTGAIGWFDPPTRPGVIGDFCLSVPIRTLVLQPADEQDCRKAVMGVGAGIVFDSRAEEEFEECQLKAKFLTGLTPSFSLFETIYAKRDSGCRNLKRHLERLQKSATYFGFRFEKQKIETALLEHCRALPNDAEFRLKLTLNFQGEIQIQTASLAPIDDIVSIRISRQICSIPAFFLAHKSTHRAVYDQAWQEAEQQNAFDSIFVNKAGFVTEGGRCNIFIRIGQDWITPPLSDGVLPGVMRAVLLDDRNFNAKEASFTLEQLKNADEILVCNALRGAMRARLLGC
ncbi:aminodeoxychorismate synthase component I [Undibacterium fentianense]|uniref:Aminodeoxychorismate synthase component I n=1 Tax=Undibacterium fentianense TaxID=2828728 RepID=A0A941IDW8_9BURK|nr:aminodeoxychorismate synthase component I [Undibacterium fentianense]MBR7800433.1 aminodeoxychorismate synthase component I [Undibacterium fentianense]